MHEKMGASSNAEDITQMILKSVSSFLCCRFNPDSRIHNPAALTSRQRNDWIQIQFVDLKNCFHELRQAQHDLFKYFHARGGFPPITSSNR